MKAVITTSTADPEIDAMAAAIARTDVPAILILQPVTPSGPVRERPAADRLLALVARLSATLPDVRLIPQTHPVLGAP